MNIHYELTEEDYINFNLYHIKHSKVNTSLGQLYSDEAEKNNHCTYTFKIDLCLVKGQHRDGEKA